jgi:glycosyltransferase involved in cell wall biosynthesis
VQPGTISVVIPAYNSAAYLAEAIESARQQTRAPLEIVVVDDASSDGSADVAAAAGACVYRMPANGGPSAARNLAIRHARGDYIAMLDADDSWEPHHCATVAGLLDANPAAALACARARLLLPEERDTNVTVAADTPLDVRVTLFRGNLVAQTTVVARRGALLEVGGYDTRLRYAEDYDLWMRLARTHPFVFSHAVTARYRVHAEQASRNTAQLAASAWTVRRPHFVQLAHAADEATTAAAEAALLRGLDDEIGWAYHAGDRRAMEAVIAASRWVPGGDTIVARWQSRLGVAWPLWRTAATLKAAVRTLARRRSGGAGTEPAPEPPCAGAEKTSARTT